ncbi:MAG TPA: hypothetical protein VJY42_04770 [Candidatus Methanomethylophilaceae archaeon]|nr:hypothetical protein [Candidatus Methanomethylophilaceae archaeon]
MDNIFKIAVYIPEEFVKELMEGVNESMSPIYSGYDMTFSMTEVTGTWRPLEGSNPFIGKENEISIAKEIKVEFAVRKDDLKKVIKKIVSVHPYEEPGIDVIPMYGWKSVIQ